MDRSIASTLNRFLLSNKLKRTQVTRFRLLFDPDEEERSVCDCPKATSAGAMLCSFSLSFNGLRGY